MSEWIENTKTTTGCPEDVHGLEVVAERRNGTILRGMAHSGSLDNWDTSRAGDYQLLRYMLAIDYDAMQKQPAHDPVNKPSHYMLFPEQGIEFIDVRDVLIERLKDFTPKQIDYWSRAFEYLARAGGKNGVEDIKKAKWYLDRLVATLEEQK